MAVGGNSICKRCERFFKQNGRDFCDKCYSVMNKEGKYIRTYLEQNPGASLMDMSLDLNISMKNANLFLENQGSFLVRTEVEESQSDEQIESEDEKKSKAPGMYMTRRRRR